MSDSLRSAVAGWMDSLCNAHPDRHVGGPGNRAATDLFTAVARQTGFEVDIAELDCLDWRAGQSTLQVRGDTVPLHTGPFSHPCEAVAVLSSVSTIEELESGDFGGTVLLMHGPIAAEQLMAKNFTFYNPESHRRIVSALEHHSPLAVVAATGKNPGLAGSLYPFPLIEDGDFDIPNAYLKDVDGGRLLEYVGEPVTIRIDSTRIAAKAAQPIAFREGRRPGRIAFYAHVDTKHGTPGALDNGTGVAALLALMTLLEGEELARPIEVVPFNGEDYYAVTGQMHYVARNRDRWKDIALAVNADGAAHAGSRNAFSLYGVDDEVAATVRAVAEAHGMVEGPQWPQGDHSILAMQGVPAVAVTCEDFQFITSEITHTAADSLDKVDMDLAVALAGFFADIARAL